MSWLISSESTANLLVESTQPIIKILGIDSKITELSGFLSKPREIIYSFYGQSQYILLTVDEYDKPIYVKIADLAQITGISITLLEKKDPDSLRELLNRHDLFINFFDKVLLISQENISERRDLLQFAENLYQIHNKFSEVLDQMEKVSKRVDILQSMIRAGSKNTTDYIGKDKISPSLAIGKKGEIYVSGEKIGSGTSSKVNVIETIGNTSYKGVKIVAREFGVHSLNRHLDIVAELNRKGVTGIPSPHRLKVFTKTKSGKPKLVAILDWLNGDAGKLVGQWGISSKHICNILIGLCKTIGQVHENGMLHSDVKSANILLKGDPYTPPHFDDDDNCHCIEGVLHDFGFSTPFGSPLLGCSDYAMPPECIKDNQLVLLNLPKANRTLDLFSLGVTILELSASAKTQDGSKFWGSAKTDDEIKTRILFLKKKILGIPMLNSDKLLRIRMIEIAPLLLKIDPKMRISAQSASNYLMEQFKLTLQDIQNDAVDIHIKRYQRITKDFVLYS